MKKPNSRHLTAALAVIAVITALIVFWMVFRSGKALRIEIDSTELSYIVCSSGDFGPYRLDYAGHQTALDDLIAMLEGDYRYARMLRLGKTDGGGPNAVSFYDEDGNVICKVFYRNGYLGVRKSSSRYALYEKTTGEALSLTGFEAYLKQHGVFTR